MDISLIFGWKRHFFIFRSVGCWGHWILNIKHLPAKHWYKIVMLINEFCNVENRFFPNFILLQYAKMKLKTFNFSSIVQLNNKSTTDSRMEWWVSYIKTVCVSVHCVSPQKRRICVQKETFKLTHSLAHIRKQSGQIHKA